MRTFLAVCAVLASSQAFAQAPAAPEPAPEAMPISMIKPNLYMITGDGGNSELLITDKGALLVDTKLPGDKDYNELMRVIGTVTKQPIKVVIITHHHVDHAGNDERFIASGAQVIGQKNMPKLMEKYFVPRRMKVPLTPPATLYDKTYNVKLGKEQAKLYYFGIGHTGADTVVLFPKLKTIVFSDLLVADPLPPLFDGGPGGGSLRGTANVIGEALKLDWDTAVPGHGEKPLTRADVVAFKGKLDKLAERVQAAVDAGTPKDQVVKSLKTDDLGWKLEGPFWSTPERLDILYAEFSKNKK
jgi:glyoxylase-like metal-dependent hydrolase (beta-lactamase superfamily II)